MSLELDGGELSRPEEEERAALQLHAAQDDGARAQLSLGTPAATVARSAPSLDGVPR